MQRVTQRLRALYAIDNLDAVNTVAEVPWANDDVRGPEAFELLVKASGQIRECVSLTSVWAFINVMFWQLCDLEHENGVAGS